ncbi:MAG: galactonate dehydratase [Candidatus Thermofonsia Clade 1 bacterium]|jgi:galactonate dehydratase|uniref:Galactonate dehydratase n=1 Tax=Candidatus Thermofonsia Clade 1 bacterium TaxID=2364210 RepID=A0A2M8PHI2_9CHLR|nr:MAG: galactonate dehydratase [Candidatus Thermofonsia Clade 1 bacterium]RMF53439.1 MAG: galactonate dehydratase [Chloroflexota bacterium]
MKITQLELFTVPPRWLFLKISTDEGLVGWGEPIVEGHAQTVAAAVREAASYLIGRDPDQIEEIWQTLYRARFYRGGAVLMSAMAGIDQALWDIKGKRYGVPIYQLLGGAVRDHIRVYAWIGGDRPADVVAAAQEKAAQGFTAIKMNASEEMHFVESHAAIEACVARVAALREAMGSAFGIAVDFHGRLHKPMAKVLAKALEPYHPLFIEEPVLPEHNEALPEIAAHAAVPIATGERMYSRWDFKTLLARGGVDIIQPDLSHAGGITEVHKIAAMAEAYDVALAPHCPLGPIALAACLQIDAVCANAFIQEQSLGLHYNQGNDLLDYLVDPSVFAYANGMIKIPSGPGLGIQIDEAAVRAAAERGHDWRNPVWRRADGSIAEW